MNINPDYETPKLNALSALDGCLREIADIIPNEDKLTHEQKCILGIVAMTLETIAEKAHCFEQLQNGMDNENSLN